MNVVLYMRYSSDRQTEQSIEGQQRVCTEYCERQKYNIVGTYIDRALSASKNTDKREEFLRMIKDSEKGGFDAVVVYKLDRFARNRYDSAIFKNKLKKNGVRVISATENISDTPEGVILEAVLEGMAEFYSKELSQKVTRGMNETALKCNSCGGYIPLGYKIQDKKYVIDPLTAPIVEEAFSRYAAGETITEICEIFNGRGLRTAQNKPFNKNSFKNMFHNERYIGVYKYKDVRIEGGVPAIVSKETFDAVQERLKKNAEAPARGKAKVEYLLSQKIFCGHCGALMIGECGTSKNGKTYNYYSCSTKKTTHTCDKKNLRKEWIERVVAEDAYNMLNKIGVETIADMAVKQSMLEASQNKNIPVLEAQLIDVEQSISNLFKLVERGADSESLFTRLRELEKQKNDLRAELMSESLNVVILEKSHVVFWLNQFAKGDINDINFRRKIINMLVNSVTVWDEPDGWNKITTIYNIAGVNPQTVSCSDIEQSGSPAKRKPANRQVFFLVPILHEIGLLKSARI